jgi:putative membrane protein
VFEGSVQGVVVQAKNTGVPHALHASGASVISNCAVTVVSFFAGASNSLSGLGVGHYILFLVIGVLISLTQIIPGLSATVLLMMFGYYTSILNGIGSELLHDFKLLLVYICIIAGFAIGILTFSKVINFLLEKKRRLFFYTICGLSIGSVISVFLGNECLEIYDLWNVGSAAIDLCIGAVSLALGFAITFALYIYDKKRIEKIKKSIAICKSM